MAIQWFYQTEGQQWGPIPAAELLRLAEAGVVTPDTAVRKGVDGSWVPAKKVRGLFRQSNPPPLPTRAAQAAPADQSEVTPPPAPPPSPSRPLGATGNAGVNGRPGETAAMETANCPYPLSAGDESGSVAPTEPTTQELKQSAIFRLSVGLGGIVVLIGICAIVDASGYKGDFGVTTAAILFIGCAIQVYYGIAGISGADDGIDDSFKEWLEQNRTIPPAEKK